MNYKQRYEDILAMAKELREANQSDEGINRWIDKIFPELAESEDERIRKELIDYFSASHATDTFRGIPWDRVVAWLENIPYVIDQEKREGFQLVYKAGLEKKEKYTKIERNEDERIRKGLINYFNDFTLPTFGGLEPKKILSWLEKQGSEPNWCHHKVDLSDCSEEYRKAYYDGWNNCNQQHSQCKSELDDVVKCLINGMKFYYEDNEKATWGTDKWSMPVKHIIDVLEKQDNQKPTEPKPKFKVGDRIQYLKGCGTIMTIEKIENGEYIFANNMGHTTIESGNNWYLVERNLAWSEEDENRINRLIAYFEDKESFTAEDDIAYANWLISLKGKVRPQTNQEWSEEDERIYKVVLELIDSYSKGTIGSWIIPPNVERYAKWLKSIKNRYTWKPSDEQMYILNWVANILLNHDGIVEEEASKKLQSLYNDLKKLKG